MNLTDPKMQVTSNPSSPPSHRSTASQSSHASSTLHPSLSKSSTRVRVPSLSRTSCERSSTQQNGTCVRPSPPTSFLVLTWYISASSVTLDPILHFILYVPSVAHRPMRIQTNSGALSAANGFISPQAGGVVIYNPPSRSDGGAPALPDLNDAFRLFEQQIQKLFGVPKAGQTSGSLPPWQVDAMVRARLLEAAKETVETLDAIVKLAESLPNMRVGKEVQRDVHLSLQHLEAVRPIPRCLHARTDNLSKQARIALPHSLRDALQHASTALSLSSKAYFNPTMLALLYFPDEHKYAVYTPFFGPVAVPLLGALFKEIKEWKERRRIRNAAEKERKKDEAEGKKKKSE
jgi:phosphatidylinositol glycan class S